MGSRATAPCAFLLCLFVFLCLPFSALAQFPGDMTAMPTMGVPPIPSPTSSFGTMPTTIPSLAQPTLAPGGESHPFNMFLAETPTPTPAATPSYDLSFDEVGPGAPSPDPTGIAVPAITADPTESPPNFIDIAVPAATPANATETFVCELTLVDGLMKECCGPEKPWEVFHNNCNVISQNFSQLCSQFGLQCTSLLASCAGPAGCAISHAISAIQLDGKWYFADPTSGTYGSKGFATFQELVANSDQLHQILKKDAACTCSAKLDYASVPSTEPSWCFNTQGMTKNNCLLCCVSSFDSCVSLTKGDAVAGLKCEQNRAACELECSKGDDPTGAVCVEESSSLSGCQGCCLSKFPFDAAWYASCSDGCKVNFGGNDIAVPPQSCNADAAIKTKAECKSCCDKYINQGTHQSLCGNLPAYVCGGIWSMCNWECEKKPVAAPTPTVTPAKQ